MSKGPGRIERRVEEAFLRNAGWISLPSLTRDVFHEYYRDSEHRSYIYDIQHKHAVSVRRAADKVAARLGWLRTQSGHFRYSESRSGRGGRTYYVPTNIFLAATPDIPDDVFAEDSGVDGTP